jgi:demethylmenaquinone methyltransferase/2-methoxy-6-polyprenyl-1,4-benzoquinol methylase
MASKSFLTREEVRDLYDKRAGIYDLAVWFYYLAGMRIGRWRRMAVDALALRPGDTVVEVGCGTGLNFSLLERAVGSEGKIIGIDISEAMLERAKARVHAAGWDNVELVCCAAADYRFPDRVDGMLSTGALTFEPEFDEVIEQGAKALAPGTRWVVLDFKIPNNWLRLLAPLVVAITRPFGISLALTERHPWELIQRHLHHTRMQELYGGFAYIVSGAAPSSSN